MLKNADFPGADEANHPHEGSGDRQGRPGWRRHGAPTIPMRGQESVINNRPAIWGDANHPYEGSGGQLRNRLGHAQHGQPSP